MRLRWRQEGVVAIGDAAHVSNIPCVFLLVCRRHHERRPPELSPPRNNAIVGTPPSRRAARVRRLRRRRVESVFMPLYAVHATGMPRAVFACASDISA